ncbi:MAG: hypothetical protein LC799_21550 [Actinobacteria bacterium]|nr:hypothetical protein [Actinomycetota bacterium]
MASSIGRGILAGIAGTGVMTAFQKFVEMPVTGREDSYAPAMFAEKVLPVRPTSEQDRYRLNYVTHFGLGTMWGAAYGVAAHGGLRGRSAVMAVFATVYTGDVLLNTALGLYQPSTWSTQDLVVDVLDKFVQAWATGAIFDRFLDPSTAGSHPRRPDAG